MTSCEWHRPMFCWRMIRANLVEALAEVDDLCERLRYGALSSRTLKSRMLFPRAFTRFWKRGRRAVTERSSDFWLARKVSQCHCAFGTDLMQYAAEAARSGRLRDVRRGDVCPRTVRVARCEEGDGNRRLHGRDVGRRADDERRHPHRPRLEMAARRDCVTMCVPTLRF